jgi:small subunit ribosomal protein S4
MTRITCKKCRRAGESLCGREKCAFKKRPSTPGIADAARKHRSSKSEYGEQLRDKQKVKVIYGLREKQFANYIEKAMKNSKNTAETIFASLESRLDNTVFRAGFANTRALARQIVSHGHITVNGRKVNIATYSVKEGEVIAVREGSKVLKYFTTLAEKFAPTVPGWMTATPKDMSVKINGIPKDATKSMNFQSVIEFYSR